MVVICENLLVRKKTRTHELAAASCNLTFATTSRAMHEILNGQTREYFSAIAMCIEMQLSATFYCSVLTRKDASDF